MKHLIIAATQGEDHSIKALMNAFKEGLVGKEVLAATLRAHQATKLRREMKLQNILL